MKIQFVDAREVHKKYPDTFQVPSHRELKSISEGDSVKLSCAKERFWSRLQLSMIVLYQVALTMI